MTSGTRRPRSWTLLAKLWEGSTLILLRARKLNQWCSLGITTLLTMTGWLGIGMAGCSSILHSGRKETSLLTFVTR